MSGERLWGVCLAAVAALGLAACGGSSGGGAGTSSAAGVKGIYGSLPPVGTPIKGGTITEGQLAGQTPNYIFPIVPTADASAWTLAFQYLMFMPLYNGPNGGIPEIDLDLSLAAAKPTFSDGDKTVTVRLKRGFKWTNGQPVDANDVIFGVDLDRAAVDESAANWSAFTPGQFPQSLTSITAPNPYTVVFHLDRRFNPGYFTNDQIQGDVFAMPSTAWNIASTGGPHLNYNLPANAKKIYNYLSKQGGELATFGSNPLWKISDGPFTISSFSATNSSFTVKANPSYGGSPKPYIDTLSVQSETGVTPMLDALKTGELDVGSVDFSQLGQIGALRADGYSVYGYPQLGWFGMFFNFKDKTGHFNSIIGQLYARQALAYLVNQPAYLSGIFKNAGVLAYGPVPSVPPTPYTPADAEKAPYPYSPSAAVSILRAHGWKVVPNGQTTCQKAGSASGECGAGIPAGTPFSFPMYYASSGSPSITLQSEAFASEAKQAAGINIALSGKAFNYVVSAYDDADPSEAKNDNAWGMLNFGGYTDSFYPTTASIFNTTGDYNQGGYSDPTANTLINNSVYGSNPDAVSQEASYLAKSLPVLFTPNSDYIYAVSKKVGGSADSWLDLTDLESFPQYWYLIKR